MCQILLYAPEQISEQNYNHCVLAFRDDYRILIQVNVRRKKGWAGGIQGTFKIIEIILYDTVMVNI